MALTQRKSLNKADAIAYGAVVGKWLEVTFSCGVVCCCVTGTHLVLLILLRKIWNGSQLVERSLVVNLTKGLACEGGALSRENPQLL